MIDAGLWQLIRSRPFDNVAAPDSDPRTILVSAFFSDPEGPEPNSVMDDGDRDAFAKGLRMVATIASCGVTLLFCGEDPSCGIDFPAVSRHELRQAPSHGIGGLVHQYGPASPDRPVWYIDWQSVIEIGRRVLGQSGAVHRMHTMRSPAKSVKVVRAMVGTPVAEIRRAMGITGGHVLSGTPALLQSIKATEWLSDRLSVLHNYPSPSPIRATGPILPLPALEAAAPGVSSPVLLLRALAVGDDETAIARGVLNLGPEDLALCSYLCVSGNDYAALLANMLARIADDWNAT